MAIQTDSENLKPNKTWNRTTKRSPGFNAEIFLWMIDLHWMIFQICFFIPNVSSKVYVLKPNGFWDSEWNRQLDLWIQRQCFSMKLMCWIRRMAHRNVYSLTEPRKGAFPSPTQCQVYILKTMISYSYKILEIWSSHKNNKTSKHRLIGKKCSETWILSCK